MRMGRLAILAAALGAWAVGVGVGARGAGCAPQPVPFRITVAQGQLEGSCGQTVLLRGVNVNALVAYAPDHPEAMPLTEGQVAEMASLGFDLMRLPLSLSRLEPRPGVIDQGYLAQIAQVVGWAQAHGLWVLLDLHQDRYAAGLFPGESDGMPGWMVDTLGLPERPLLFGVTDPAVQGAFTAFWEDRNLSGWPLWRAYDLGLTALARRFAQSPAVAGYDVMNEPNPGLDLSPDWVRRFLLPFYAQAVAAIRAVDPSHPIFLEPDVVSAALGNPPWPRLPFLREGVVFAPHTYLPAGPVPIGHGASVRLPLATQLRLLDRMYRRDAAAARADGLPWLVGEFGAPPSPAGDRQLAREVALQDRYRVGSAFWLWSIRPGAYPWGLVGPNGEPTADARRLMALASPHPTVVGGRLVDLRWNPSTGAVVMQVDGQAQAGPTVLVVPSLGEPPGWRVVASLTPRLQRLQAPAGGTVLQAVQLTFPPHDGPFSVSIVP